VTPAWMPHCKCIWPPLHATLCRQAQPEQVMPAAIRAYLAPKSGVRVGTEYRGVTYMTRTMRWEASVHHDRKQVRPCQHPPYTTTANRCAPARHGCIHAASGAALRAAVRVQRRMHDRERSGVPWQL
jgi:hypothetical protein